MADAIGFWSYVHADDDAEMGRITKLREDIVAQYTLNTGDKVEIFIDKAGIGWGEDWEDRLERSLSSVIFLIAVITPSYLYSPVCRKEIQTFTRKATSLGIKKLVLSLLYVEPPEFSNDSTQDELIQLIKAYQWEDWTQTRFLDRSSEGYRRHVDKLVKRLVEINISTPVEATLQIGSDDEIDKIATEGPPGTLDLISSAEDNLPLLINTLDEIRVQIEYIGTCLNKATDDVNKSSHTTKGFGPQLIIAKRLSKELLEPVDRIWELCNDYVAQIYDIDLGYKILINQAIEGTEKTDETKNTICEFVNSIRILNDSSNGAFDNIQGFINAIADIENLSRDLRPVMRKLKQGLSIMFESRGISNEWVRMIDSIKIDCDDYKE